MTALVNVPLPLELDPIAVADGLFSDQFEPAPAGVSVGLCAPCLLGRHGTCRQNAQDGASEAAEGWRCLCADHSHTGPQNGAQR